MIFIKVKQKYTFMINGISKLIELLKNKNFTLLLSQCLDETIKLKTKLLKK